MVSCWLSQLAWKSIFTHSFSALGDLPSDFMKDLGVWVSEDLEYEFLVLVTVVLSLVHLDGKYTVHFYSTTAQVSEFMQWHGDCYHQNAPCQKADV